MKKALLIALFIHLAVLASSQSDSKPEHEQMDNDSTIGIAGSASTENKNSKIKGLHSMFEFSFATSHDPKPFAMAATKSPDGKVVIDPKQMFLAHEMARAALPKYFYYTGDRGYQQAYSQDANGQGNYAGTLKSFSHPTNIPPTDRTLRLQSSYLDASPHHQRLSPVGMGHSFNGISRHSSHHDHHHAGKIEETTSQYKYSTPKEMSPFMRRMTKIDGVKDADERHEEYGPMGSTKPNSGHFHPTSNQLGRVVRRFRLIKN